MRNSNLGQRAAIHQCHPDRSLVIIETHPVQYHAPVYRMVQEQYAIPVTAIYGSDFSVAGYRDSEFQASFAWDTDLLTGYSTKFLSSVTNGGKTAPADLDAQGVNLLLSQLQPSAILLTGYNMRFYRQTFWQVWRSGWPLLFRAETTDHAQQRSMIKARLRDGILRWFYQRFNALLPIGQHSLAHYRRLLGESRPLFFSPYCVDTTPFQMEEKYRQPLRAQVRQNLNLNESQRVLLFTGKLVDKKAPKLLEQAVKFLAEDERQRTTILFLGSGPLQDELQQLANSTPKLDVRFLGFQNQKALSPYYHAADLLVLPSRYGETWGLVVNEALHHGVPCIVSDAVGSATDLIVPDHTGVVFSSGSAQGLAAAILQTDKLVGDPAVRQQCRQHVSRYTITHAAKGIAEAYEYVVRT